ncbi:type VI secretion system protein TssA [Thalassomonas haliotis]|uniref:Type VI secretion system protein TssA n=1 Tax=Thalassomonas haliotis TaxID=485448 RepID=A0ABY7V6N7_9GAMM|nr:type VI secretion system protein TssA [Thalassomonas haliotis]WDE09380.1 type VI secretion system protein TssA [Thalassomonas haliotis]
MRLATAEQSPDEYIQHYYGYTLSELLAPIGKEQVGESVRHNGVYFNIKQAREADDPTLPMGVWTHELKTADWQKVKELALEALAQKSKDLQLGVWLFEASIHIDGFAGIAPAALLIKELCERYWPNMHPEMVDGDIEYRTNTLNWLNKKLLPVLGLIPITQAQLDGEEYCWNDWESACHYDKLKNQQQVDTQWDGPTPQSIKQRLAATSPDELLKRVYQLEDGLLALNQLQDWLDNCCGNDSPNLSDIGELLRQIDDMLSKELARRGIPLAREQEKELVAAGKGEGDTGDAGAGQSDTGKPGGSGSGDGPIRDRSDAFICLRKAAEFLMQDDPHSPVPYLVYTACEWGEKSAPDLYQELFLAKGGQLNIFEIMGLNVEREN